MKRGAFGPPKNRKEPKTNTSRKGAAGRIVAGKSWSTPRPYLNSPCLKRLFGRGRLVFHIHDLDAAVGFGQRLVRVLELGLAVSDGDQIGTVDAVFLDQIALDRVGAP